MDDKAMCATNWSNVRKASAFAFVDAFQFTFLASCYLFISKLDLHGYITSTELNGIVMALSGLGEALSAPPFGWWANRVGRINPPLFASLMFSIVANLIYLSMNQMSGLMVVIALCISRFFSGVGSGNRGCVFAYITACSKSADRSKAMACCGGGFLMGLTVGQAIQSAFVWLGCEGIQVFGFRITMYTAPALPALLINFACIAFLYTAFYDGLDKNKHAVAPAETNSNDLESAATKLATTVKINMVAAIICMTTRSARMFIQANMDTLGLPYSQVMFNLTESEAITFNSIVMCISLALVYFGMLLVYGATSYTKYVSPRTNCIGALVGLLIFHLLTFAWPMLPTPVDCSHSNWSWCQSLRKVNIYVFEISYVAIFGVSIVCLNISLQTLYSQVLGSGQQGTMQGINQAVGSFSRIMAPPVFGTIFHNFGPLGTWTVEIGILLTFTLIWIFAYHKLEPPTR